jgi:hypothetical protein
MGVTVISKVTLQEHAYPFYARDFQKSKDIFEAFIFEIERITLKT